MIKATSKILFHILVLFICIPSNAQHSVAREWNELLLEAIRDDYARPTVHARNLYHTSIALYDAWAAYDDQAQTFLLGREVHGFFTSFNGITVADDIKAAREEAMSYAAYRLLTYRFSKSPNVNQTQLRFNNYMLEKGYLPSYISTNYGNGNPADLGNYIGARLIAYGKQDGANELLDYENQYYEPINESLLPAFPGNPDISDPNRWQPLALEVFIDQSGNVIVGGGPPFLGPEWGLTQPFSLKEEELSVFERDGNEYWVYHDPGAPPLLDTLNGGVESDLYKWNFEMVSAWSSHLDPHDGVLWDISPKSIGNIQNYPSEFSEYSDFYDFENGGDPSPGWSENPITKEPYTTQMVPRGDYTRVLAEFWADGPDSETPPGHWFTLLNYVSDHPDLVKKMGGKGEILDDIEWDVKTYLALGGAMHDAAISAWGIKGYYDYIRPVSVIRYLADNGQSSDTELPSYNKNGINLKEGLIELVLENDPLAGDNNEHVNKIKVKAWKGPDYIDDPSQDEAGVDWILAENWWPYQRPSFVTPPFAGFVSGHSTYSRAAAEVLTLLTGSEYFPGGMGEFHAPKNDFLVFEDGPSVDLVLQWATYQDASDQCSLSRIWGGIHPPADDILGRQIGMKIGPEAFEYATAFFEGTILSTKELSSRENVLVYPNPTFSNGLVHFTISEFIPTSDVNLTVDIYDESGKEVMTKNIGLIEGKFDLDLSKLKAGIYLIQLSSLDTNWRSSMKLINR